MSIQLKKSDWEEFTSLYGSEMYKDKLICRARKSDEDPNYVEVIFGQGMNHTGYDLVEKYLYEKQLSNKGEQNV